jgi:putative ABC transport system permease protein
MIKVALAGLFGRKLRTALTAFAIVLGVAMVSGTLVLTDSIDKAFNFIYTDVRQGSDVVVTGKSAVSVTQGQGSFAPTVDQALVDKVRALPDVARAEGSVNGTAQLVDRKGKAITFGGSPNLGFSIANGDSPFNPLHLVSGSWPRVDEVVVDANVAKKKHLRVGDPIGVQAEGAVQRFRISGIVKFGSASALGGATLAGFDIPTAQRLFGKPGQFDEIAISSKPNVSEADVLKEVRGVLPTTAQARSGTAQAREDAKQTNSFISFLRGFLLAFGGIALFVGSFVIANS